MRKRRVQKIRENSPKHPAQLHKLDKSKQNIPKPAINGAKATSGGAKGAKATSAALGGCILHRSESTPVRAWARYRKSSTEVITHFTARTQRIRFLQYLPKAHDRKSGIEVTHAFTAMDAADFLPV